MTEASEESITITLRIPGRWAHPSEIFARLPEGHRLTEDSLYLPNNEGVSCSFADADDQFAGIFRSSCRKPPSTDEQEIIDNYTVNCLLSRSFSVSEMRGNKQPALTMMAAASAIVAARAGGVFVDNCAISHGGLAWQSMHQDGGADAISFAFVNIVRSATDFWTMGMHVLGLPDILIRKDLVDSSGTEVIDTIRHLCTTDKLIEDGHFLADENGPRFKAKAVQEQKCEPGSPMFNPFGRLRLLSLKEIAESN